uniref:HAT C-terminal dimerisation domain-containing protein n=1 Tax=Oryza brachyantha TaxID=4533 RepID=J3MVG9_ORYBR
MEICLKASQPLRVALRIADGDETPAAPKIMAAMDHARSSISDALKDKPMLLNEVLECHNQMEQKLYGAALYLNPDKFFAIREKRQAARLRSMFNDVVWKMVIDEDEPTKIIRQADDGDCFSKPLAIRDRDKKNPILWWGAYGGLTFELAKRIISLCCSASGCERNWSAFAHMSNRFQKTRQLGSKGKRCNLLLLEEFQRENEWVDDNCDLVHAADDDLNWANVDKAIGAT